MSNQMFPARLQQGISVQRVGDEVLLYDEERHQAFCLNPTSARVWELCDGEHSIDDLAIAFDLDAASAQTLVQLALDDFRRDGLLETPTPLPLQPAVSRRAMIQSLGASAVLLVPVVAAVFAPKAAQAYNGCFNCTNTAPDPNRTNRIKAAIMIDNQRKEQAKQQ